MKILHIADLHLGKKVNGYSLMEDQKYFLNETIKLCLKEDIHKIMIAGDIYDVASPSGVIMEMWSDFLTDLVKNHIEAFIIPGNHDSKERVGYMDKLADISGIHVRSDIHNVVKPVLSDGINFYMIPYMTHQDINASFNQEFKTYKDAMEYIIGLMKIDTSKVNILIAHQLVLPSMGNLLMGGSEEPVVGTIQNIPSSLFQNFDYVALGHIHKGQKVAFNARYAGSPICYHKDEAKLFRHYTVLDIEGKNITVTEREIVPLRNTIVLRDTFDKLLTEYEKYKEYYLYAEITSPEVTDAMSKLKNVFPYTRGLSYIKEEGKGVDISKKIEDIEKKDPKELFMEFYKLQTGLDMTEYQIKSMEEFFKEVNSDENK